MANCVQLTSCSSPDSALKQLSGFGPPCETCTVPCKNGRSRSSVSGRSCELLCLVQSECDNEPSRYLLGNAYCIAWKCQEPSRSQDAGILEALLLEVSKVTRSSSNIVEGIRANIEVEQTVSSDGVCRMIERMLIIMRINVPDANDVSDDQVSNASQQYWVRVFVFILELKCCSIACCRWKRVASVYSLLAR